MGPALLVDVRLRSLPREEVACGGMTLRTGTSKTGNVHRYYTCGTCQHAQTLDIEIRDVVWKSVSPRDRRETE
jgi:hypothetical protein